MLITVPDTSDLDLFLAMGLANMSSSRDETRVHEEGDGEDERTDTKDDVSKPPGSNPFFVFGPHAFRFLTDVDPDVEEDGGNSETDGRAEGCRHIEGGKVLGKLDVRYDLVEVGGAKGVETGRAESETSLSQEKEEKVVRATVVAALLEEDAVSVAHICIAEGPGSTRTRASELIFAREEVGKREDDVSDTEGSKANTHEAGRVSFTSIVGNKWGKDDDETVKGTVENSGGCTAQVVSLLKRSEGGLQWRSENRERNKGVRETDPELGSR